jgi:hypothetical protein
MLTGFTMFLSFDSKCIFTLDTLLILLSIQATLLLLNLFFTNSQLIRYHLILFFHIDNHFLLAGFHHHFALTRQFLAGN